MTDRDEWGRAVRAMTELDRQLTEQEPRRMIGATGDREDARDE